MSDETLRARAGQAAGLLRLITVIAMAATSFACSRDVSDLRNPPREFAVTTASVWNSMIYVRRTDSGVVAVDLGWMGARDGLSEVLARLGAAPRDIRHVFITHSHRDHIGAWRMLRSATFYMTPAESALFVGAGRHAGLLTEIVELMRRSDLPRPGELRITTFARDTTFVLGSDTVWAFPVPGHTAGSAAYLVGKRLFAGDAITGVPGLGLGGARWAYSDDVLRSDSSVKRLWSRLPLDRSRLVCTAHAMCAPDSEELRREALR
jgi:glyoxylase-like metal-dependent hydrolase (beta-lactamase superfamily II)